MLIRRVVPAIAATLAAYAALAIAAAGLLREHYLTPLVTSNPNPPGTAWIISQWWTKDGRFAFVGNPPINLLNQFCSAPPTGQGKNPPFGTFAQCLAPHGYTQWTSYQPATRFWPFQWIEGGWLLALSALLIAQPCGWSSTAPPDASRPARRVVNHRHSAATRRVPGRLAFPSGL